MIRLDLLALDEAKLATLATRGHVKRAIKDLAAGRGPSVRVEPDGTVVAVLKEAVPKEIKTRLPVDVPLQDAPCTCDALKVCRHRVMAVLAYQRAHGKEPTGEEAIPWSPGGFSDEALADALGRWALARATKRRSRGFVADVVRGATPSVELATCTVRFLVRDALSYARCDCHLGVKCEHIALAVWASREADELPRGALGAPRATVEVGAGVGAAAEALEPAMALARTLLLDGALGSGAALANRFARAERPLSDAALRWPLAICEGLEETLSAYASRGASYRPERIGELLTELHARARSATGSSELPARAILGMDEPAETPLEHLRLVSLGCRISRDSPDPEGGHRVSASVYLADPDTQTVLVLNKMWDLADEVGAVLGRRHVGRNIPLGTLARGQMVTKAAKRRANRALVLSRGGVGRTSVTPQRGDWSLFGPPLHPTDYGSLRAALRELPPAYLRPRLLAERVRVLSVECVGRVDYHPGEQTLFGEVHDAAGETIHLELAHSAAAPAALDALAEALRGDVRFISGEVRREGDWVVMTPLSVVTDRVIALDIEPVDAPSKLSSTSRHIAERPLRATLRATRSHLDRGAHEGLRHVGASWREQLGGHGKRLRSMGLGRCAERVDAVHAALAGLLGGDPEAEEALTGAWLDASLRVRLALEAGS